MTTINNSENLIEKVGGIEKAREIVEDAPEGKSFISGKIMPAEGFDVKHGKYVMCDGFYKFHWCNGWDIYSYAWHDFVLNVIDLNDLRTAIASHEPKMHSHLTSDSLQGDDIAEHDREFKVGDLVCFIDSRIMFPDGETKTNELFKVIRSDGLEVDLTEIGKLKVYKTWVGDLRHATPSEIKTGHRLEAERHG